ncbi:fluoride efflux transporter FluC [Sporosarcina siberiensis]|uniref:Fluoride-specific ion channel FluC n=1 Tax=Sporosarcina siberiensis TaxID=1365606 RepID=A0ABW4SJB0_9BACL
MKKLVWIGFAGAVGAITRTTIGHLMMDNSGVGFPWGTFSVNMIGTFLLCCFVGIIFSKFQVSKELEEIITIGFIGSFTTFSAFSIETILLVENEQMLTALLYVGTTIIGGLFAGKLGFYTVRKWVV